MKNQVLKILATVGFIVMTPCLGLCAVGDTQEEAEARYGIPLSKKMEDGILHSSYIKENTLILTEVKEGRVVLIVYTKQNPPYEGNVEEIGLSPQEVEAVLQLHGGLPSEWKPIPHKRGKLRELTKKGLLALENPEKGRLLIASKSRFSELEKKEKAED